MENSEPNSTPPPSTPIPLVQYVRFPAIKVAPKHIQDDIKRLVDEGCGAPTILKHLIATHNYKPAVAAVTNYIKKYRKQKEAQHAYAVKTVDVRTASILDEVHKEISHVNELLGQIPTTSDKANVLKSIVGKCVDRVKVIEKLPLTPQNEGILVRYLGEIRENVSLFNKLSEADRSEEAITAAVQQEFVVLLSVIKEIIAEICPEHLPEIASKLKLRLQSYVPKLDGLKNPHS